MKERLLFLFNLLSASPRKWLGRKMPSGAVVADVGCGAMVKSYTYVYLPHKRIKVVGLERFDDATIYGKIDLPPYVSRSGDFELRQCDLDQARLPFPDASVDGVFFSHVIEHVRDRAATLREIARILKPRGYLYVETPGERSTLVRRDSRLRTPVDAYPYNFNDDPSHLGEPLHLRELRSLLAESGFSIECSGFHREFGIIAMPLYVLLFLLSFVPFIPLRRRSGFRGFAWWNLVGWGIYAVARKM
jgi:SAM-dependent methyltransferase